MERLPVGKRILGPFSITQMLICPSNSQVDIQRMSLLFVRASVTWTLVFTPWRPFQAAGALIRASRLAVLVTTVQKRTIHP